jgi:transketolase-like protein
MSVAGGTGGRHGEREGKEAATQGPESLARQHRTHPAPLGPDRPLRRALLGDRADIEPVDLRQAIETGDYKADNRDRAARRVKSELPAVRPKRSGHFVNMADAIGRSQPRGLDQRCVNTVRFLAVDTVQNANSGHPAA